MSPESYIYPNLSRLDPGKGLHAAGGHKSLDWLRQMVTDSEPVEPATMPSVFLLDHQKGFLENKSPCLLSPCPQNGSGSELSVESPSHSHFLAVVTRVSLAMGHLLLLTSVMSRLHFSCLCQWYLALLLVWSCYMVFFMVFFFLCGLNRKTETPSIESFRPD